MQIRLITLFVVLWILLWVSTFNMHHRIDFNGQPSVEDAAAQKVRQEVEARLTHLADKLEAAEADLESLIVDAMQQRNEQPANLRGPTLELAKDVDGSNGVDDDGRKARQSVSGPVKEVPLTIAVDEHTTSSPAQKTGGHQSRGLHAGHPILDLDDDAFFETPVNELMSQYGGIQGGGSCENDFGNGLIDRWRATGQTYCAPRSPSGSSIKCYLVKQTRHHGTGDQLCLASNVLLDTRDFTDSGITNKVMADYKNTKHMDEAYIHYRKGTLQGNCDLDSSKWKKEHFPGWNNDWRSAFESVADDNLQCDVWEDQPTLLLQRDTFANFFHNSEDFVNTFIALAVLKWSKKDLQLILADLYPMGPFWDLWGKVFKGLRPPLTAWDLKEKYGGKKVCYRNLAIGILGAASPVTVASWQTPCKHTPLVRAYADYVVRGLELVQEPALWTSKTVTVTWMARRASSMWPERRFCDSEHSFFRCEDWQHLNMRPLGRMVRNDQEVVKALRTLEDVEWPNGVKVVFRDVDFNVLSFEEQIQIDVTTDVMVGPHGAGLMHNIFMPDRAVLLELHIDGSGANMHFHNLAKWQGRTYMTSTMKNPIPTNQITSLVSQAIRNVAA